MTKVVPVGYFRELRHGLPDGPSLGLSAGRGGYLEDKARLISYLKSGVVYIASPGVGFDVLSNDGTLSGPFHALTDGAWMWPADLAYYVDRYDVELPNGFLSHARAREWRVPEPASIDLSQIEVDA